MFLVDSLDCIDLVTRAHIERYLVEESDLDLLVSISNLPEIIEIYPRHLTFEGGTFIKD